VANVATTEDTAPWEMSVLSLMICQMIYAAQIWNVLRMYLVDRQFAKQQLLRLKQQHLLHLEQLLHHLKQLLHQQSSQLHLQLELLAILTLTQSLGKQNED
jgi:uncharacterized membrane protein YsdA (DUF1294 family)